jgi:hypothetical protein
MREGQYDVDQEYYILASQRRLVYDELIALTRLTDRQAIVRVLRELLSRKTAAQLAW